MTHFAPSEGQLTIEDIISTIHAVDQHDRELEPSTTIPMPASFSRSMARIVDHDTKEEALARVASNANPAWMAAATGVVRGLCETKAEFTTDDVWSVLDNLPVSTTQRKAMGSVMTTAAENNWCQIKDCRPVPSKRPACHRRPIPVWESLIHPSPV